MNGKVLRWTQRPIEASHPIHVLSVLGLLLFPDSIQFVVAWHLRILRRFERRKPHHLLHLLLQLLVRCLPSVDLHLPRTSICNLIVWLRLWLRFHWRC